VQYQNPEVDRLLELGVTQSEQADRKATYAKIQQILLDECVRPTRWFLRGGSEEERADRREAQPVLTSYSWNVQEWRWA